MDDILEKTIYELTSEYSDKCDILNQRIMAFIDTDYVHGLTEIEEDNLCSLADTHLQYFKMVEAWAANVKDNPAYTKFIKGIMALRFEEYKIHYETLKQLIHLMEHLRDNDNDEDDDDDDDEDWDEDKD